MDLLAEQPAHAISLREVARRAGVSHNAPYHHFGDRAQLLKVLAERSMADLVADQRRAVAGVTDATAVIRALGWAYIDFALRRPHAFAAIYDPEICVPGAPTPTMAPLIAEMEESAARAARVLVPEAGAEQVAALAAAMWGSVHGLAQLGMAGHLAEGECAAALDVLVAGWGGRHG